MMRAPRHCVTSQNGSECSCVASYGHRCSTLGVNGSEYHAAPVERRLVCVEKQRRRAAMNRGESEQQPLRSGGVTERTSPSERAFFEVRRQSGPRRRAHGPSRLADRLHAGRTNLRSSSSGNRQPTMINGYCGARACGRARGAAGSSMGGTWRRRKSELTWHFVVCR